MRTLHIVGIALAVFSLASVSRGQGVSDMKGADEIRRALDEYVKSPRGSRSTLGGVEESGVGVNDEYRRFAALVSNDNRNVFANVGTIATNEMERLFVFAAGWQFGEGFYLSCLDELADLALGGRVTADEIRWYTVLNYNSRLTNILRIRYREPLVTNIVHKLMRVDPGRRKYYGRILDGSSYRDYLDEMKACLWD